MRRSSIVSGTPKYLVGFLVCTALRLVPGRPPNVEPILSTVMPFSKAFGPLDTAIFAALNMIVFDVITGKVGLWTWITAGTYACVAGGATLFFHLYRFKGAYVWYAMIGTLFFDFITGVLSGPLLFQQPFMEALLGQIPFTLNHLVSNVVLALVVSPLIERWVIQNDALTWDKLVLQRLRS